MSTVPSPLPALFAGLRTALEADARTAPALQATLLTFLLRLLAQLESLARTWHQGTSHPASYDESDRLPFHLRLRDARRALILSRASRGRRRIPTWWARNRGARAIPGRARPKAHASTARAPPHPVPA